MSGDGTDTGGLEAYVDAIETALRRWRGREHVLSPRDFALARAWNEAGVPLAAVLVAIDDAFSRDPGTASLAPCRRRVEQLAGAGPRGDAGAGGGGASLTDLAQRLEALRERLLELPGRATAIPLAELSALIDLVAVASRPNWDYLRERLRHVDDLVTTAAVEALTPAQADQVRVEADRAAERHRGRVDEAALEQAAGRLARQRAREIVRLPRVSTDLG